MKSERQPPSESVIIMVPVKPSNSTSEEMPDCDNEGTSGNVLEHVWPLIFSLKLFGLYFVNDIKKSGDGCFKNIHCHTPSERARSFFDNPLHLYSFGVLVMLWLNVARMTSVFTSDDVFGNVLFSKIGVFTWMLMCALLCTAYYTACRRDVIPHLNRSLSVDEDCARHIKKMSIIFAAIAWLAIVVNTFITIYGLFFSNEIVDDMMAPCYSLIRHGDFRVPKSLFLIVNLYLNAAWVFPIAMNAMFSSFFYHRLSLINSRFRSTLKVEGQNEEYIGDVIEAFRQEHQSVSRIIKRSDRLMALINASLISCLVAIFITMLYTIIFYPSRDPVIVFAHVFWIFSTLVSMSIAGAGCILVNHAVCKQLI